MTEISKKIAEASGTLDKLRGAEISNEISKKAPFSEQIAVAMNALEAIFVELEKFTGVDSRPNDFKEYQKMRTLIKEKYS